METPFRVIGVDPGFRHLGFTVANVSKENYETTVIHCSMTDLHDIKCNNPNCIYDKHDRSGGHLTLHFVENNAKWFSGADFVVMEQQPITSSLKDVEHVLLLLIKQRFAQGRKEYARRISPRTLHAFFNMSHEKTERRKEVVCITNKYLSGHRAFEKAVEKDHIADSCAFILLFVATLLPGIVLSRTPNRFEKFKFVSSFKLHNTNMF
jgi:hypothetical protein